MNWLLHFWVRKKHKISWIHIAFGDALNFPDIFIIKSGFILLGKGDLFGGDVSSDKVITSEADVKALTFCELQSISLGGLRKVNEIYPEYLNIIKEDLRYLSNQSALLPFWGAG